jgi:hypothetical protein
MARLILANSKEREIRDRLKIARWVQKPSERRKTYFSWCDQALAMIGGLLKDPDEEPPDESILAILQTTLKNDGTFWDHVTKKRGDYVIENDEEIYRIGAGTIYHEYLVAKEKQQWP